CAAILRKVAGWSCRPANAFEIVASDRPVALASAAPVSPRKRICSRSTSPLTATPNDPGLTRPSFRCWVITGMFPLLTHDGFWLRSFRTSFTTPGANPDEGTFGSRRRPAVAKPCQGGQGQPLDFRTTVGITSYQVSLGSIGWESSA